MRTAAVLLLLGGGGVGAQQTPPTTPNIGLYLPARGSYGWDSWYNLNWKVIDATLAGVSDIKSYGAVGNGTADDTTAFKNAVAAMNGRTLHIPAGTYSLNNASAPIALNAINGTLEGDGANSTVLSCTSLTNFCIQLLNSSNVSVRNLSIMFATAQATCNPSALQNCVGQRNGKSALYMQTVSNALLSNLYLHDAPGAGLLVTTNSQHIAVDNCRVSNVWANAYMFTNSSDVRVSNSSSDNTQDAAVEFSHYDGQAGTSANAVVSNFTSFNDFSTILVDSYQNVSISNVTSLNTWVGSILILQDPGTTTTRWPDNISISNVVIVNPGANAPSNPAVRAIQLDNFSNTPPAGFRARISLENIRVNGASTGTNATSFGTAAGEVYYDLNLNNIAIDNQAGVCFDFFIGYVHASHLSCTKAGAQGYVIRGAGQFFGSDLRAFDVASSSSTVALQQVGTGFVSIDGFQSGSSANPSRVALYDSATSGTHIFHDVSYVTADGSTPTVLTNGANVIYDGVSNGQPLVPIPTYSGVVLKADSSGLAQPQMLIQGATNGNQKLFVFYDTVNDAATLQASKQGTANQPLLLNPNGGGVRVNNLKATTGTRFVCVNTAGDIVVQATACSGT